MVWLWSQMFAPARHSTFNFSVPELSWLAALLLLVASLVLHFVPIRILLLLWGIVKFSRRLLRPHSVPNNEVLDLLSRVPDNEQMASHRTALRDRAHGTNIYITRTDYLPRTPTATSTGYS